MAGILAHPHYILVQTYMIVTPGSISTKDFHAYLLGSVAPRPICFASTIDKDGNPNLSPFSFFNVFGSKPPVCVFSPARRVRDNTTKHTLENIEATGEVVISVVNYAMVHQVSLASCEYPRGTNEFEKAGFTAIKADKVKPFLVQESPVNLECKLIEVYKTGEEGGAGNLVICEVLQMHIKDEVLGPDQMIDPHKIDLVARMGKDYYCRASGDAVFEVPKPNLKLGIGFDQLPGKVRNSKVLTGNDLGMLANVDVLPLVGTLEEDARLKEIFRQYAGDQEAVTQALHTYAQSLLKKGDIDRAWNVLLSDEQ